MKTPLILALSSLLLALPATAFDNTGHEVVAQIAWDTLAKESPGTKQKLEAIINADPRPLRQDLLVCAIWPDLNKHRNQVKNPPPALFAGAPIEGDWHFVDIPYEETDPKDIEKFINMPGKTPNPRHAKATGNVVIAIRYYSALFKKTSSNAQDRADYLSWLTHYVGDVHQPLHCVSVNEELPNYDPPDAGDRGGNGFTLSGLGRVDELHALWDDQLDLTEKEKGVTQNAIHPDHEKIKKLAEAIEASHPKTSFATELKKTDPKDWALESFSLRAKVYAPQAGGKPTDEYLAFAKSTVEERVALAGYRLAQLLKATLGQ